ncbi:MAG: SepM family pheromone-processing serine protease [Tuberibacillus sp.]
MSTFRSKVLYIFIILILLIAIAFNVIQVPYFVSKPGTADKLAPMVKVSHGYKEKGTLRLVTIYQGKANLWDYLLAKYDFNPYTQVTKAKYVTYPDESEKEMSLREINYMDTAQQMATYVAYKAAGKKPTIHHQGVLILNVNSKMPAGKVLKAGDVIKEFNGKTIRQISDLQGLLKGLKEGTTVQLTIKRGKTLKEVETQLAVFPKEWLSGDTKHKVGLGILQSDDLSLEVNPPVKFDTQGIGGPSAGLMMSLEIYNQLTPEDLTKGYDICGTGTIDFDGVVGPIGGIKQKVVAADKAGADIFFAPAADHEAKDALKAAKDIHSDIKVVPVKTFDDARNYLQSLKPKK